MHELSIAQEILKTVRKHLPSGYIKGIKCVKVMLGNQSGIKPESLEFSFKVASMGTPAEGAKLDIERVQGEELNVAEVELVD